jgi:hypothetical protein
MLNFLFGNNRNGHLRRVMVLLEEAQLARIEHQAAAEHHAALARMYSDRAKRLERELYGAAQMQLADSKDEKAVLYALDPSRRLEAQASKA